MQRKFWTLWAAAVLSAGLLELPFPLAGPLPLWRAAFAWIGLVPLLWAILSLQSVSAPRPLRRAFLLAYLCGVLWYSGNCYWIYDTMRIHGGLSPLVSVLLLTGFSLILGLYFGFFGLALAVVRRASGSVKVALLASPFLWTAFELAASRITCVPWDQLGYSQVDSAMAISLAPWTGVYGISFWLVAFNAMIAYWILSRRALWQLAAIITPFLISNSIPTNPAFAPPKSTTTATAMLVQPNLDVGAANNWVGLEWDRHIAELTRLANQPCKSYLAGMPQTDVPKEQYACPAQPTPPDLVVWPEAPAPYFEYDHRFQQAMRQLALTSRSPLVVGSVGELISPQDGSYQMYNSALVFSANGERVGRYDKIHLVPFGEYIPFQNWLTFAHKLTNNVGETTPGTERKVFRLNGHRYGVFICYESVFADEVRHFAQLGAEVLVNISDDGWYGDTSAPWQHLNMARMRAIENRRWILRDTNNGVTAAIDPYGRVVQSIPRHTVDALPARYGFSDEVTFYTAHGDIFACVCALIAMGAVGWSAIRLARLTSHRSGRKA